MEGEETSKAKTLADKREEASKLDSVLRALQSCLQQIDDIERRVRSAIGTKSKGTELLEEVDKTIVGLKEEIATYEDTEALDGFRTKTTSLREIADYFKEKQELEELEKQARDSSRLVQDIEKRTLQLQNLQGSAEAIRSVIMEELKTETLAAIGQLGQLLNQYYSAVTGHTYFTDLVFETDPKKPLLYNVRAASADKTHSTYLGTRFSTAQMNLAAIALFLSMNQSAMTEVRTIIMDDPSQSMDLHHKNALAKLLCEMSNSRQIVLATQDAELGGEIRTHPPKNINIYEFRVWSTNGPSISHESKE
jgi:exonuclease SbcC